jgi:ABC-type nitrate/sulfonate/bicarbonate transport system substrate-binding protein
MLDQDLDARHGLDVKVVQTGGTAASIQQTLAGEVDAGEAPVEQAIQVTANKGAALRMIAGSELYYSTSVVAAPGITGLDQLRGKKISVVAKEDSTYYLMRDLLAQQGVAENDWTPVFTAANSATRYAALKAGSVDAVVVASPLDLKAADEGYSVVADLGARFPDFAFTSFVATQKALTQDKAELGKFVAAYGDAANWLLDPANADRAKSILRTAAKIDAPTADRLYSLLITDKKAFARDAVLPAASIENVQAVLVRSGLLAAPRPVDQLYSHATP